MKVLFFFSVVVLSGCLSSQNFSKGLGADTGIPRHHVQMKKDNVFATAYANNVRAVVMADFLERFGEVSNVSWYVDDKQVSAYFVRGKEQVTVQYRPDGLHLQTRKNYDGAYLDSQVSQFLERELGKKLTLNLVTEVIKDTFVHYEVSLHSNTQIHVVRVFRNLDDGTLIIVGKDLFKKG